MINDDTRSREISRLAFGVKLKQRLNWTQLV